MVIHLSAVEKFCENHSPVVKLSAGASIVKRKPVFSFDSRYVLVPSGCDIKVFSIASGECTLTFKEHQAPVIGIQLYTKNNLQALSCSADSVVIRWDYSDGKLLMKYMLRMKDNATFFYAPTISTWFITTKFKDYHSLCSVEIESPTLNRKEMILKEVDPHEGAVAIGRDGTFVAGICDNALIVRDTSTRIFRRHLTGQRKLLCVAAHPSEFIVATGDHLGCIIVWTNFLHSNHPTRSMYHWHALPLGDLVFSVEGSHIYSGGGESVLVKWNLSSGTKQMLPRLGLPICRLAVSPDNMYIATSHIDNGIQIIDSHSVVVQIIQGLTQGHSGDGKRRKTLPTGMLYDPRSSSIIMNGRPGHLQFYDIRQDRQLFNLDIVGRNFISQEKDSIVFNTDIERAAIDCKGLWLATVECRDDGETSPEIRLKFWNFDVSTQKFVLNTNIFLPHHKKINCLKFRPEFMEEEPGTEYVPLAVTTSDDCRFKIWVLSEEDKNSEKSNWFCELMGYYKELPAGRASFSEDGSLLAVAFGQVATLWSPDTNVLKATLSKTETTHSIKHILFGRGQCCHLLVCSTNTKLTVWNVLSLSVLWNVSCDIECLVEDPLSEIMASFSADNRLYIFKPSHPKPIAVVKHISSSPVIAAIFVPHSSSISQEESRSCCCWLQYTKLYFMNQKQEVLTVTDGSDEKSPENEVEQLKLEQRLPATPYSVLQAEHKSSGVQPVESKKHIFFEFRKKENVEINELPCPSNVNPITLCAALLPSLLNPRKREEKKTSRAPETKESNVESDDSESDSERKIFVKPKTVEEPQKKINRTHTCDFALPQIEDFVYLLDET